MLRAIPATYRGVRFRSRLEAAWARVFDLHSIRWTYESEGYDLDGIWYLPDFYLPAVRTFVEVKGIMDPESDEKVRRLARESQMNQISVVVAYAPAGVCWELVHPDGEREMRHGLDQCDRCGLSGFHDAEGCRTCPRRLPRAWRPPYAPGEWVQVLRWWAHELAAEGRLGDAAEFIEEVVRLEGGA